MTLGGASLSEMKSNFVAGRESGAVDWASLARGGIRGAGRWRRQAGPIAQASAFVARSRSGGLDSVNFESAIDGAERLGHPVLAKAWPRVWTGSTFPRSLVWSLVQRWVAIKPSAFPRGRPHGFEGAAL